MYFLIYIFALFCALAALVVFLYRTPTRINEVFFAYRRTNRLKNTIRVWMFLMGLMFVFVQWMRYPFYAYLAHRLADPIAVLTDGWGALHTLGLLLIAVAEITLISQWATYLFYAWVGVTRYHLPESPPLSAGPPEVIVLIPACNEDPEILIRSVSSVVKLDYPNYRAYLVENSRDPEYKQIAVKLAEKHGLNVVHVPNRGHKAGAVNDATKQIARDAKYVAIFDVDHEIKREFLRELVPILENDSKLAFIQTPQLYANAEESWVCRAAAMQENLLYDTILEAKGSYRRALCCGSNDIVRIEALDDVGGWDETSVSEDLATSLLIHEQGWESVYHRKAFAIGIGPTNLRNYWAQQKRWAEGNTGVAKRIIRKLLTTNPRKISWRLHLDYLWSAGYYMSTLALAYLAIVPMLLTVAVKLVTGGSDWMVQPNIRPIEWVYLSVYPLYAVSMMFPYVHMRLRGYALRNLLLLQGLLAGTIPIYVVSVLRGLLTNTQLFVITPKISNEPDRPLLKTMQTYIFILLMACGAYLVDSLLSLRAATFSWLLLFWIFAWTVSSAHLFLFKFQNRLMKKHRVPDSAPIPVTQINVPETESQV